MSSTETITHSQQTQQILLIFTNYSLIFNKEQINREKFGKGWRKNKEGTKLWNIFYLKCIKIFFNKNVA